MPPAPERRCGSQWRLLSKCSFPSTSRIRQLILYEFCKQSECVYVTLISPPVSCFVTFNRLVMVSFIFILCALPDSRSSEIPTSVSMVSITKTNDYQHCEV